ncbi:MAG TPA: copper-binding protein [Blastocatellia bacterium]|nr:copper-binding protein [Blastocatellia bacterium]
MKKFLLLCLTIAFCFCLLACQKKNSSETAGASSLKRFQLKGNVVSLEPEKKRAKIQHEDIPGFMDAMTMSFTIKDDANYEKLQPGDHVEATLVYDEGDNRSWLENLQISKATAPNSGS